MGRGHGHALHFHGHSPLHRAPAHLKIVGLLPQGELVDAEDRSEPSIE